jgi:hypothetical protein
MPEASKGSEESAADGTDNEAVCAAWFNTSVVMFTAALLLYHMVSAQTLRIPPKAGAALACALMLLDVGTTTLALVPYVHRQRRELARRRHDSFEPHFFVWIVVAGAMFSALQIAVCGFVIRDCAVQAGWRRPLAG